MDVVWSNTRRRLKELKDLLACKTCMELKMDMYSFEGCDHSFCKACATFAVNETSKCPCCGTMAWMKELKINRQLANTVRFCCELEVFSGALEGDNKLYSNNNHETVNVDENLPSSEDAKRMRFAEDVAAPVVMPPIWEKETSRFEEKICGFNTSKVQPNGDVRHTYSKKRSGDVLEPQKKGSRLPSYHKKLRATHPLIGKSRKKNDGDSKQKKRFPYEIGSTKNDEHSRIQGSPNKNTENRVLEEKKAFLRANLEKKNKRGETALHRACIKGDLMEAKILLEHGANPNSKDFAGWTPLHEASNHGFAEMIELLLDSGALINMPGYDLDTPLHDAVRNCREEAVQTLLKRGACTSARNKSGLLPIDFAQDKKMKSLLTSAYSHEIESKPLDLPSYFGRKQNMKKGRKLLFLTGLSDKEKDELCRWVTTLEGDIVADYNPQVTHLVTSVNGNNTCSRTTRYLTALLKGIWIVSHNWVKQSFSIGSWLPETDYEVSGTEEVKDNIPQKARLNAENQLPRLFDGCSFYLHGTFTTLPKEEVKQLLVNGNGKILTREPKIDDEFVFLQPFETPLNSSAEPYGTHPIAFHARPSSGLVVCTQYIVYDEKSNRRPKTFQSPILATVPLSWILECVSRFELIKISDPSEMSVC